ncbi:hypothetical protein [Prosthecobacter fluviatilis]|uniref:EF-hand domain-containing protein n=1 Tax=Prosthecobacter fluviatilis TaxID=445931 RepID=A0ABW0KRY5_9BACT
MKLKKTFLCGFSLLSLACFSIAQDAPKGPPPEGAPQPPREGGAPGRPPGGPGGPGGGDAAGRAAEFVKRLDTNGDGKINKEEFAVMSRKMSDERFGQMDSNGDGLIDQEEAGKMAQRQGGQGGPGGQGMRRPEGGPPGEGVGFRRPEGGPPGEGGGFRRPPGGEGGSPGGPPQGSPGMRPEGEGQGGRRGMGMFDPKEAFKRMDTDANGSLSPEEYAQGVEKMREMFRGRGGQGGPGGPGGMRPEGGPGGAPGGAPGEGGGFRRPPVEGDAPTPPPAPDKPKE